MSYACQTCGAAEPPLSGRCPGCGVVTVPPVSPSAPTLPPSPLAPTAPPVSSSAQTLPPDSSARRTGVARLADAERATPDAVEAGPLAPGQSFGRRYHIKRLLGLGGMGAVYQGWDTELGIDVAIKLIRPEIMADQTVAGEIQRRFKRELLLARLVTHQNVVRIHDLGEIEGRKYITMS